MARKTFEEKREEIKQLTQQMDNSIDTYFETPEQMAEQLTFLTQFREYSLRNTLLIQSQFKGAQAVGSYKFWQDKEYNVQKGEKGIKILVPNKTKAKFEDLDGKWKLLDRASDDKKEQVEKGVLKKKPSKLYFTKGNVFDISQTNAKASDLPELFPNKWLEGNVQNYDDFMDAMKKVGEELNVTIGEPFEELGSAKGAFYYGIDNRKNHIGLNSRNSQLQNVKTLLHELGHAQLHNPESNSFNISTEEKEFQAEMTAYSVASSFGIDTSDYSLKYLANWTKGKELKDKERLLGEVRNTALSFIDTIENHLNYSKEVSQEMEQKSHREQIRDKSIPVKEFLDKHEYERVNNIPIEIDSNISSFIIEHYNKQDNSMPTNIKNEDMKGLYYFKDNNAYVAIDNSNGDAFTEEFVSEELSKKWLKQEEVVQEPKMYIRSTTIPELKPNTMIDFVKGDRLIQEINERYNNPEEKDYTQYNVIIPDDSPKTVFIHESETFDFGNKDYISPYQQIRENGKLDDEFVKTLDNAVMQDYKDKESETEKFVEDTLNKSQSKHKTTTKKMDM